MAETDPLAKMILQPATEQADISDSGTYTETWKGPWSQIKLVTSTQKVFGTTLIIGQKRPNFNNGNWSAETEPPQTLTTNWPWVIQNISIRQEASGDNGYLTLEYKSQVPSVDNSNPDGGTDPEKPDDDDYQKELSESKSWTLTWSTFNRSVLEYSTNPDAIVKFKKMPAPAAWSYYTDSTQAKTAAIPQTTDNKERKIATYYTKGVSPQFHYPVVTCHQEYTLPEGKPVYTDIGADLDKKCSLPNECPFKNKLTAWQWIQVADTGTIVRSKKYKVDSTPSGGTPASTPQEELRYVRETTWQGANVWDDNFYGTNAWTPTTNS